MNRGCVASLFSIRGPSLSVGCVNVGDINLGFTPERKKANKAIGH